MHRPQRERAFAQGRVLIALWRDYVDSGRSSQKLDPVDEAAEALLALLLEAPQAQEPEQADVDALFAASRGIDPARPFASLAEVPDDLLPIAVMREILKVHHVRFDPKGVARWSDFVARYGRLLARA